MTQALDRKLRVALIGGGKMALQHAAAIAVLDSAELIAVVDPYFAKDTLEKRFGIGVSAFASTREMYESSQPDVVHIVTPPASHVDLAREALNYGAHAYVEKPFALHSKDAKSLLLDADGKGLKLCAAHQVLFQKSGYQMREALPLIGEPVHIESYFSFRQVRTSGRGRLSPVEQLVDILPHPVYLLLSVLREGQPLETPARITALSTSEDGEVRAIVECGSRRAFLLVSLRARPVESYLRIAGVNGSLFADFVISGLTRLTGPGFSAPAVVLRPYQQAFQLIFHTTANLFRMLWRRHKSYPGLAELIGEFYTCILNNHPSPVDPTSIVQTVELCEEITESLRQSEKEAEQRSRQLLSEEESKLPRIEKSKGVLLTGGTGFLGRAVAAELRQSGFRVRVPTRKLPQMSARVPGVEYIEADLSQELSADVFNGLSQVVHLAAETHGSPEDHRSNTIIATNNLAKSAAAAGITNLIEAGSIAVLKPPSSPGDSLSEKSPVDDDSSRGPYVNAKAEQERILAGAEKQDGMSVRTIRLGPLVDYSDFEAPGRLGRDVGPVFIAAGSPSDSLAVCDVHSAAQVFRYVAEHFSETDRVINLVEAPAPTRRHLILNLRTQRPDLRVLWLPFFVIKLFDGVYNLLGRMSFGRLPDLSIYPAFASQKYDTALASRYLELAQSESLSSVGKGEAA